MLGFVIGSSIETPPPRIAQRDFGFGDAGFLLLLCGCVGRVLLLLLLLRDREGWHLLVFPALLR